MIRVSVTSTETRNQKGVAKASQKPYDLHFQTVWLHTIGRDGKPNPYPEKVEIICDRDEKLMPKVYQPGEYQLAPESIYVARNGDAALSIRLKPLTPKAA